MLSTYRLIDLIKYALDEPEPSEFSSSGPNVIRFEWHGDRYRM